MDDGPAVPGRGLPVELVLVLDSVLVPLGVGGDTSVGDDGNGGRVRCQGDLRSNYCPSLRTVASGFHPKFIPLWIFWAGMTYKGLHKSGRYRVRNAWNRIAVYGCR